MMSIKESFMKLFEKKRGGQARLLDDALRSADEASILKIVVEAEFSLRDVTLIDQALSKIKELRSLNDEIEPSTRAKIEQVLLTLPHNADRRAEAQREQADIDAKYYSHIFENGKPTILKSQSVPAAPDPAKVAEAKAIYEDDKKYFQAMERVKLGR